MSNCFPPIMSGAFYGSRGALARMREFGNLTFPAQEYREQKGLPLLENLWRD